MEFDKDESINDEKRRLAESKKLTIQPMHSDISPEEDPDSEIVARHLNAAPIANADNDIEQNAPLIQPADGSASQATYTPPKLPAWVVGVLGVAVLIISATVAFLVFSSY